MIRYADEYGFIDDRDFNATDLTTNIKLVILDVDGVLTDGTKKYHRGKPVSKSFHDLDFTAIKVLKARGIHVCFITSDEDNATLAADRHIDCIVSRDSHNRINKVEALERMLEVYKDQGETIQHQEILVVGDDVFDVPLFRICGVSICPYNSPRYVHANATAVMMSHGGSGMVLSILEGFFGPITDADVERVVELDAAEVSGH